MLNLANNMNQIAKKLNIHKKSREIEIEQLRLVLIDLENLIQKSGEMYEK